VVTAVLLATLDGMETGENIDLVLKEKVGSISCTITLEGGTTRARFVLPKLPTRKVVELDRNLLGEALGLDEKQFGQGDDEYSICDGGVPFPIVPLADLNAMAAIEINEQALDACFNEFALPPEIYVYCRQCTDQDANYHVRLFAPGMGIAEDPATGGAAAAFAAQIMACDRPADGEHKIIIEQGIEMGRPSRIELIMKVRDGHLVTASIGGAAVMVSEGMLHI